MLKSPCFQSSYNWIFTCFLFSYTTLLLFFLPLLHNSTKTKCIVLTSWIQIICNCATLTWSWNCYQKKQLQKPYQAVLVYEYLILRCEQGTRWKPNDEEEKTTGVGKKKQKTSDRISAKRKGWRQVISGLQSKVYQKSCEPASSLAVGHWKIYPAPFPSIQHDI